MRSGKEPVDARDRRLCSLSRVRAPPEPRAPACKSKGSRSPRRRLPRGCAWKSCSRPARSRGTRPEEIREPYALRRRFPALGANSPGSRGGNSPWARGALELSALPRAGFAALESRAPWRPLAAASLRAARETAAGPVRSEGSSHVERARLPGLVSRRFQPIRAWGRNSEGCVPPRPAFLPRSLARSLARTPRPWRGPACSSPGTTPPRRARARRAALAPGGCSAQAVTSASELVRLAGQ